MLARRLQNVAGRLRRARPARYAPLASADDAPPSELPPRRGEFDREHVLATYLRAFEHEGRLYNYVVYPGEGGPLCVHFSAFFGEWGERPEHRPQFQGYFHRLRMFWPLRRPSFLFVCDTFGADRNGTYYKGERGDFFVERATAAIVDFVEAELGIARVDTVMLGSSMGATAALRFALERGCAGAVAVSPHIDLDLCARHQGRARHIAAVLGSDDVEDPRHYPVTREVRTLAGSVEPRPRLAIQSAVDDHGVHDEQVVPLVELWRSRGGVAAADFRPDGGHSSVHATAEFFEAAISWCADPTRERLSSGPS